MAVNADLENVLQGNLSQYRQSLNKTGNPRTATEMQIISSQQSAIGKTQLSRYYNQLDSFFEERYNRASDPNLNPITKSDKDAIEFQRRCRERGVPIQAMMDIDYVEATRTVGQGSQFANLQLGKPVDDIARRGPFSVIGIDVNHVHVWQESRCVPRRHATELDILNDLRTDSMAYKSLVVVIQIEG